MLVAGEESLSTWPRAAAAAQQSSESERARREREREEGWLERDPAADGRGSIDGGKKKRTGFLWAVFSVSLKKISVFFFLSLPFKFLLFLLVSLFIYLFSSLDIING